jgi:fatty acid desaturase
MKQLFGQIVFTSLLSFAVFGSPLSMWVGYAENIITFSTIIMFFVMIACVIAAWNLDDILKKSPPKKLLTPLYVNWSSVYYVIVILLFIMAGWFLTAIIWAVTGFTSIAMMHITNDTYHENHPDDKGIVSSKSKLQEMANGNE